MITRLLSFLTKPVAIGTGSTATIANYCSFDCYDDGGCPKCSEWVEWEDEDYGTVGEWHRKPHSNNW